MKTRWMILTMILLLSLAATPVAAAKGISGMPKWEKVFDPVPIFGDNDYLTSGVEFKNRMYFGGFSDGAEDQVWGTPNGKHWSLAWKASSVQEEFEAMWWMYVFKDQLYLFLLDADGEHPGQIMRTGNGKHWEMVAVEEWGDTYGSGFCGITSFQGALYLANCYWSDTSQGVRLTRSTSGDPGTWEEVADFPDWTVDWGAALSFDTFKGALYVISDYVWRDDTNAPAEIWRSFDGENWEAVITDGFGDPLNIRGGSFGQKSGYLYASMGVSDTAGDIYRTTDGMNWEPVTLDGFGEPENLMFTAFVTYQNRLYTYGASFSGCRVYNSADGVNWTLINDPGWGEPRNIGVMREYGRVIFKGKLYSGAVGPGGVFKLVKP